MRCKVSKQNQRVNKNSKRTKHNPPSSKLSKRKEAAPKGGKRIKTREYRGVRRKGQKFTSTISFGKPFYLGIFQLHHIETYQTFDIPIPEDEPLEDFEADNPEANDVDPKESLDYLLSLIAESNNKLNEIDLKEYRDNLIAYAEEN